MLQLIIFQELLVTTTIFNITRLYPLAGEKETLADFSNTTIGIITEDGKTVGYQLGSFTFKIPIDESIMAKYGIFKKNADGNFESLEEPIVSSCDFFDNFNEKYLPPLTANRNDFPQTNGSECPKEARTYNLFEADSLFQLSADSELRGGEYLFYVIFLKENSEIGGFSMHFDVLKCEVIDTQDTPLLYCDD